MKRELTLQIDGKDVLVTVYREGDTIVVERDGERHEIVVVGDRSVAAGAGASAAGVPDSAASDRTSAGAAGRATSVSGVASSAGVGGGAGDARAPMVGVVREVHVVAGDAVDEGERLITMEAMKMDIYVNAPVSGKIAAVHCKPGDTATEGAVLVTVNPAVSGAPAGGATAGGAGSA